MKRKSVEHYQLLEKLGEGGMAEVYKAYDPHQDRYIAIKLIHSSLAEKTGMQRKFRREGALVAGLNAPAIVNVEEFGETEDVLFIVMPLMEGGTLADRLEKGVRFSMVEAVEFAQRLAPTLDHIHSLGIVHCDLKPGNILYGKDGLPYISDFGVARLQQPQPHTLSTLLFTPSYASPEQFDEGELDGRSDLYSFGLILYKALTGDLPYDATTPAQWMRAHLTTPVPNIRTLRSDLPKGIEKVFYKVLAKSPKERYATATLFANELGQLIENQQSYRSLPLPGKQWLAFGGVGLVIIGLGIVAITNMGMLSSEAGQAGNSNGAQTIISPTITLTSAPIVLVQPSFTPTRTPTIRATSTSRATPQSRVIISPTQPATIAPTSTSIITKTPTQIPTVTVTKTASATPTSVASRIPTISPTPLSTATRLATATSQSTATLLPTSTVPSPTSTHTPLPPTSTSPPASEAPRSIDPVFYQLGGDIIPANVASGQQYYRVIEIVWHDEAESGGRHAIQFDVVDQNRNRLVDTLIIVSWGDGSTGVKIEPRIGEPFGTNFPMYKDGPAYSATVNGFASDTVVGMGLGTPETPWITVHTEYFVIWQLATKP